MISLKRVEFENFLSYEQGEVKLDGYTEPVLVMGENRDSASCESNGSGKSAIFEAIAWGLYGMTLRGLTQREVVRKGSTRGCGVLVEFMAGETAYGVSRYQDHKAHKNSLFLCVDGVEVKSKDKRELQQQIETILGIGFKLFCESTILGQDSLCFTGATDAEKKQILERVAGIEEFEEYLAAVKDRLARVSNELISASRDGALTEETIRNLTAEQERVREASAQFESRRQARVTGLESQLQELQGEAGDVDKLKQELGALTFDAEELPRLTKELKEATDALQAISTRGGGLNADMLGLLGVKSTQRAALDNVKDVCPTCKRPYDSGAQEAAREGFQKTIEEIEEKIVKRRQVLDAVCAKQDVAKQNHQEAEARLAALHDRRANVTMQQERLKTALRNAERVSTQAKSLQKNIWSEKETRNTALDRRDALLKELQGAANRLTANASQQAELREQQRYLEFWEKGFGKKGVRNYVLDNVASTLNQYAAKYAQYLTDGEIEVVFTTQRKLQSGEMTDDFCVQGLNRNGADVYKGNSAGERQRIDVCVALALQDLIRSRLSKGMDLFVCDEAAADLDREGAERMLGLLRDLAKEGRVVYYVTHDAQMQDLFRQKLLVIKEKGVSRVA